MARIEVDLQWLTEDRGDDGFKLGNLGFEVVANYNERAVSVQICDRLAKWLTCIPF